jgi:beta-galactosidase
MSCTPFLTALLGLALISGVAAAQPAGRERVSFNLGWLFMKGDAPDVGNTLAFRTIGNQMVRTGEALLDPAAPLPDPSLGRGVAWTQPDFDDSQWRPLNLPHDWGVDGPFQRNLSGATGRLPWAGVGWYRKHFTLPAEDAGRQIYLDLDGAMSFTNIWLNGSYVGGWAYGYTSFRVDLTPYVKPGGQNVLAIRLDNPANSSRWYPGGGIYRNTWLVKTAPVHVSQWGTAITTPQITPQQATVKLAVTLDNRTQGPAQAAVRTQIFALDGAGRLVGEPVAVTDATALAVEPGRRATAEATATVPAPRLWSIKTPNLYLARTTVEQGGRMVDTYDTTFGIRSVSFDPNQGMLLNGKLVELQGVCNHHDLGPLGTAVNVRALQRQIEILKEMGCNAIRTSHNPPAPELLELCDRMGMVVMDEAFDCWARGKSPNDYAGSGAWPAWHEKDMRALVRRDRNHPSVVMWSIGNEVQERGSPAGTQIATELKRFVYLEDSTRPVTGANNGDNMANTGPWPAYRAVFDVYGFNYNPTRYGQFHQAVPTMPVVGSETASTISSRGVYVFPVSNDKAQGRDNRAYQMSSYDLYAPPWATTPDTEFTGQDRFPYTLGEFVWTGFDYIGEPTPWGGGNDPSRSSYFGIVDLCGFKKDRFYIYQARWRPELPMAHIVPHWTWPDRVGQVTPVHVYSTGDEAELFLNGQSLGRKKRGQLEYRFRWDDVVYQPGELKVAAYKNGQPWAEQTVRTAGEPARLKLTVDRDALTPDPADLSYITVEIVDREGRLVPRANNRLTFTLEGPGEFAGIDNGDPTNHDWFRNPQRNAFNGMCLAIVRPKAGEPGNITLRVQTEGLEVATVRLTIR